MVAVLARLLCRPGLFTWLRSVARDLNLMADAMNAAVRHQQEKRLEELDSALSALRKGFARYGQRPPAVCHLMIEERARVAQLLRLDDALRDEHSCVTWETPTASPHNKRLQQSVGQKRGWGRVLAYLLSVVRRLTNFLRFPRLCRRFDSCHPANRR